MVEPSPTGALTVSRTVRPGRNSKEGTPAKNRSFPKKPIIENVLNILRHVDDATLASINRQMASRNAMDLFLLVTLGSQYDQLIKRSLDSLGVFSLVVDAHLTVEAVKQLKPKGVILSGGPASVLVDPPPFDTRILDLGIPVLGICLGFQLWAQHIGVEILKSAVQEFGTYQLDILASDSPLFRACQSPAPVLQSHYDTVAADPRLAILARTDHTPVAAAKHEHLWGLQFHPEVTETTIGVQILSNFCTEICGVLQRCSVPSERARKKILDLREQVRNAKVLIALSGGTDSSVLTYLLKHAVEPRRDLLRAVYIKGLDRVDDEMHVRRHFESVDWMQLTTVDATSDFLSALKGKASMSAKKRAMREVYRDHLQAQATLFDAQFLAQGTLYTDLSESGVGYLSSARKAQIKLHHNVNLQFDLTEITPLADCMKDDSRDIGISLGVPEELLRRHPFPGSGLILRIEGEVDATTLRLAREGDRIYIAALRSAGYYDKVWQAGVVVTASYATCTKGDDATRGLVLALWAVTSVNGFTARSADLPLAFLKQVARHITDEIPEVGAVVYRLSDKPPATIEWG